MITILIRTHQRPKSFARALSSIPEGCNIIVSYDCDEDLSYIPDNLQRIQVQKSDDLYFYDTYCNLLKDKVNSGFFMFLDDDDYIIEFPSDLQEDSANIVQLRRRGNVRPLSSDFRAGQIGMPCLILHSKHKNIADIPGTGQGDYHWIASVCKQLPINFLEIVCVGSDSRGFGLPERP